MRRSVALVALVAAFLAARLPSLELLPLYSDEALGIWRAERVLEGSLTRGAGEGKPLHAWMIAAAIALPGAPIRSARAAHVAAGALVLVALWDIARRNLSPAAAWTAAALWIVLPFPMIFERTVTPDAPLAAAAIAVVACALRVAAPRPGESPRWRMALYGAGVVATFVKMPLGLALAATPLLLPWALPPETRSKARARLRPYLVALGVIALGLASIVAVRAALGLRPLGFGVHELGLKVTVVRDVEGVPGAGVANLGLVAEYAWLYLGPVGCVLLVAGVAAAWWTRHRLLRVLLGIALAWTALFVLGATDLSAHYLLPVFPFLVLTTAWALAEAAAVVARCVTGGARAEPRRSRVALVLVGAAVLSIAASSWPLLRALRNDPATAPLARTEREHYVDGRWSGYGLAEAAAWIDRELLAGPPTPVFIALHVADYERLRLYATERARSAIVQGHIDRYTLPVPVMIERTRALRHDGRSVLVVTGGGRFTRRWREAFPQARVRVSFAKPRGAEAVEIWELGAAP